MTWQPDPIIEICDHVREMLDNQTEWPDQPIVLFTPRRVWDPAAWAYKEDLHNTVLVSPFEETGDRTTRGGGWQHHWSCLTTVIESIPGEGAAFEAKCDEVRTLCYQIQERIKSFPFIQPSDCRYTLTSLSMMVFDSPILREARNFGFQLTSIYSGMA